MIGVIAAAVGAVLAMLALWTSRVSVDECDYDVVSHGAQRCRRSVRHIVYVMNTDGWPVIWGQACKRHAPVIVRALKRRELAR